MKLKLRTIRNMIGKLIKEESEPRDAVVLSGPFEFVGFDPGNIEYYEGTVHSLTIDSAEFNQIAQQASGLPEEEVDSAPPQTEHDFQVTIEWEFEQADRSVGYSGGHEINSWTLLTLDGIELSPEDAEAVRRPIDAAIVRDYEEEWAQEKTDTSYGDEDQNAYDKHYDR